MMFQSLRAHIVLAALAAIVTVPLAVEPAEGQAGGRMQVLVPHMTPLDDMGERFGERVAERVRDRLDLERHVAIDEDDADDAAREYEMRFDDLDCVFARQLAPRLGAGLVMCGEYRQEGDQVRVDITFITIPELAELPLEPFMVAENQETEAAERIVSEFQALAEQIGLVGYCSEYAQSSDWTQALDYCSRAHEATPDTRGPLFNLGEAEMRLENYEASLGHFQVLVERDPGDDAALQFAGYSAAQLGESELALEYYTRYLEMNPDNADVRVSVAYDLADAGDPQGAMELLAEGLEADPDHVGMLEQYGSSAFRAARNLQEQRPASQDADQAQDPEVVELFREATGALMRVVELEGADANPSYVVNSVRAHIQLGEYDDALQVARTGTEIFADNPAVWSELAVAANRAGETQAAIDALEQALELNPDLPNARSRMASYLLEADRVDEAIERFMQAADAEERTPDELANILLGRAFNQHINPENDLMEGARLVAAAKEFEVSQQMLEQLHFFHGYALYLHGEALEGPETVESAQASLPVFQEAQEYLELARPHGERNPGLNLGQILEGAQIYIDRQERIIERGGRR